jgi:hypothetical protein
MLGLIGVVHDDNRIEAPTPEHMGKTNNLAQGIKVTVADGPSKAQRAVTDIYAQRVHAGVNFLFPHAGVVLDPVTIAPGLR